MISLLHKLIFVPESENLKILLYTVYVLYIAEYCILPKV